MSKPWGGIGAWAAEAEREEAEERAAAAAAAAAAAESPSFPSLKEAANAKAGKKKKATSMSLGEFYAGAGTGAGGRDSGRGGGYQGLTPDEMLRLPTGPKERSPEEMQSGRLGGGFSSYGRLGPGSGRGRDREDGGDGSWGGGGRRSYGGFGDERRGHSSRVSDFDQMPSRADEVDNWKMEKKSLPSLDSGRPSRYSSLGGGGGGGGGLGGLSRADEVDNWTFGKKPLPAGSSTFVSGGFRDSDQPDRWSRGGGGGGFRDSSERERPRLVLDPPKGDLSAASEAPVKSNKPNPFGAARPREEVLAEKGLDWKKLDSEIEAKKATSRPTSAHSSRPSSAQSSRSESGPGLQGIENVVKPRPKVNPFGDAKPREVLLEEKGMDWRKIDLELERRRGIDRPETEEEKMLKEEIENLKKQLEEPSQEPPGEDTSLHDRILQKEQELEKLTHDLDEKVRFVPKAAERPGSGAARGGGGYHDRTPSQSGSFDESRSVEFTERPRSRGTGDAWVRPADDRRAFQGGRERGFLGSRDLDRSRSRDRW